MATPRWIENLQRRWNVKNVWQVIVILIVFACTGFTVLFIKKPILQWLAGENETSTLATVLYYIFILPLYNVILLGYGFLLGQFQFFWAFEKRFMERFFTMFNRQK
jgi:Na+-driven multidrug efflux pump